jgi:hypothetical protein
MENNYVNAEIIAGSSVSCLLCIVDLCTESRLSKVEVFGGYSYLRADIRPSGGDFGGGENLNGFHAQFSGNIKRNFSIAGDISGHYKVLGRTQSILR